MLIDCTVNALSWYGNTWIGRSNWCIDNYTTCVLRVTDDCTHYVGPRLKKFPFYHFIYSFFWNKINSLNIFYIKGGKLIKKTFPLLFIWACLFIRIACCWILQEWTVSINYKTNTCLLFPLSDILVFWSWQHHFYVSNPY